MKGEYLVSKRPRTGRLCDGSIAMTIIADAMRTPSFIAAVAVMWWSGGASTAQPVDGLYKNKTINLTVGAGVGGGIDLYGRLVARHLGRHLPGEPKVVVQNMPAAGSIAAPNYLFNVAPKGGTGSTS
jgi:tripartite-type tricarboxylate transporter receptor subunit TctC